MLSYRHGFHAGNHADILKHFVLSEVLIYMVSKPTPLWYIDSHAGAGVYNLDSDFAMKNREFESGVCKLVNAYQQNGYHESILPMIKIIKQFNVGDDLNGSINTYPGSAAIANNILRKEDKLVLCELHSSESEVLADNFPRGGRRIKIRAENGFNALKALLPPPTRRACVLIDPAYEIKSDYQSVIKAIQDSLKRFASGTYIIWYPKISLSIAQYFADSLKTLPVNSWLQVEMVVRKENNMGLGMFGSGIFIINPPWTLPNTLKKTMPWLTNNLAIDKEAKFNLEYHIP